jgi:large conductance mechanosensitive channel
MKNFLEEFKAFAIKGNVVDLATAVVIGTAFGAIVTSLVTNIITPLIGIILGGIDVTGWQLTVGSSVVTYGVFVQSIINFVIIAFVVFIAIKLLARIKRSEESVTEKPKELSDEVKILMEIRDTLQQK